MRALRVVLDPPVLEQHLRLEQAVELLDGQAVAMTPLEVKCAAEAGLTDDAP